MYCCIGIGFPNLHIQTGINLGGPDEVKQRKVKERRKENVLHDGTTSIVGLLRVHDGCDYNSHVASGRRTIVALRTDIFGIL
jgi:hypothetical protein